MKSQSTERSQLESKEDMYRCNCRVDISTVDVRICVDPGDLNTVKLSGSNTDSSVADSKSSRVSNQRLRAF